MQIWCNVKDNIEHNIKDNIRQIVRDDIGQIIKDNIKKNHSNVFKAILSFL